VPDWVVRRAKTVLSGLEAGKDIPAAKGGAKRSGEPAQFTLDDMGGSELVQELRMVDLNTITPIEALNLLYELKKKAGN